jgi:hypothetical protein
MNAFKPRSPPTGGGAEGVGAKMEIRTIATKDALIEVFKRFGLDKVEGYVDDETGEERIYTVGTINGVEILVSCRPKECKTESREHGEVCYSKPEPTNVARCIHNIVERVKELKERAEELFRVAEKLREQGFTVTRSWNGVTATKFVSGGYIEVYFPYRGDEYMLKVELKAKTPTKIVIVTSELAELLERLKA